MKDPFNKQCCIIQVVGGLYRPAPSRGGGNEGVAEQQEKDEKEGGCGAVAGVAPVRGAAQGTFRVPVRHS